MELFGIPVFDDDFYKMCFRFLINLAFLTFVVRFSYYRFSKKADYLFAFFLVGIVVFFLSFTLKKYEINLGLALGLFAIFGILRYRTDQIKIREMTYLFVIIGLSLINGLSNKKMSYIEILTLNTTVSMFVFYLDRFWNSQRIIYQEKIVPKNFVSQDIIYNSLENINPKQHNLLKDELENFLGVEILKLDISEVDFDKQIVKIKIFHKI